MQKSARKPRPGIALAPPFGRRPAQRRQFLRAAIRSIASASAAAVFSRAQISWLVKNDPVHVAAANPDDRCSAGLTLQRDQPKCFLHARMNKQIGGPIVARQLLRVGAVLHPGHSSARSCRFAQFAALRAVADNEQMKPPGLAPARSSKASNKRLVFFSLASRPT